MGGARMSTSARPARRLSVANGSPARRRAQWTRLVPLVLGAVLAFVAGAVVGSRGEDPRRATARSFAEAWTRGDYRAMRALLTPEARGRFSLERFAATYRRAAKVATVSGLSAGRPEAVRDGTV